MKRFTALTAAVAAAATLATAAPAAAAPPKADTSNYPAVFAYAKQQARLQGWTGAQWDALREIIEGPVGRDGKRDGGESGWNPCAVNPQHVDCHYVGPNSCGIPQANPCPSEWRGHLWTTWHEQVRWLIAYVKRRYHDPLRAVAVHHATGIY